MKKLLIILICLTTASVFATFHKTKEWTLIEETLTSQEHMAYIAEMPDGSYAVLGEQDHENAADDTFLKKVDANGNVLWTETYEDKGYGHYLEVFSDGSFLIEAGSSFYWLDTNANITATKQLSIGVTDISKTSDGYIVLDNSYSNLGFFIIKRFDSSGNPMWQYFEEDTLGQMQEYNYRCIDNDGDHNMDTHGTMIDSGASIKQTSDGGFIITGWNYQGEGGGQNVYLVKTDGLGTVVWETNSGDDWQQKGFAVIEDSNGNFVIVGRELGSSGYKHLIAKTNSSGNLIWSKTVSYGWLNDVIESSTGGYLAVGAYEDWNDQAYPYVLRFGTDGNTEWSEHTYYDGIYGYDVFGMQDSNGNYLLCGWSDPDYFHIGTSNTYMVKYSEVEDQEIVVNNILPFDPNVQSQIIRLAEDNSIHFEIDAYDPDATNLIYEWNLNWENVVSTSDTYDFNLDTNVGDDIFVSLSVVDGFESRSTLSYSWMIQVIEIVGFNPEVGDLVISEICGDGADGNDENDNGFVEILNNSDKLLSLENVRIRYYNHNPGIADYILALSGTLAAGEYIIITQDELAFNTAYAPISANFSDSSFDFEGGNDGLDIQLINLRSITIDEFNDNGPDSTPFSWNGDNVFERISTGSGGEPINWVEITTGGGTPGAGNDTPLAVSLSSFTGICSNGIPQLNWTSQSETDNMGWNIYRSFVENGFESSNTIQINANLVDGMGVCTEPTDYTFIDEYPVVEGVTYWYWLESVSTTNELDLHGPISLEIPIQGEIPHTNFETTLNPNYPNPFNPSTTISFSIEAEDTGTLTIYNVKGQNVYRQKYAAGEYHVEWNAEGLSSGIYFYKLSSSTTNITKKMILMK